MAKNLPALVNFNAGELSPDVAARVDNEKYPVGCSTLRNFIPRVQGPARRRPGTRFVAYVANSANKTLIRKFIFSQGQAFVIEFGPGYCRFYQNHAQVQSGGTPYQIASPYQTLYNADGTPALQIEQSGDVLYIASSTVWPMTLTRFGTTNWQFAFYSPPDGPFLTENSAASPAVWVAPIAGSPGQYTCYASAPLFSASDVASASNPGRLVRIDAQFFNIPTWSTNNGIAGAGVLRRNNGCTYSSLNAATTGPNPPVHTYGVAYDGSAGVQWLFLDAGYGIGQVTGFTSSKQVTLTVTQLAGQQGNINQNQNFNFPGNVVGASYNVTAITQANPAVVTITGGVPAVGDPVYLTGIGGMTQISERMFTVSAVSGATVTLAGVDSTGYSAFTSGGTMVKNASLNYSIGAWGSSSAQTPGSYPSCTCFFEDRLFWGGGIQWWGSAPGAYNSHTQDIFSQVTAACGINGIIAAQDVDAMTWMNPAILLLIGTKGGEFALGPLTQTQALGPGNTTVERQSKFRSLSIKPELINTSNFYVQASGKKVMAQDYNFYLNRYDSTNQNRLANHIAGYAVSQGIVDIAYHAEPYETLWAVRNDGVLIGFTVDRADQVQGWHEHPLGASRAGPAVVESICVIPAPDGTRDELWLEVLRTINNRVVRSIEYMEKDFETGDSQGSQCYVDMSLGASFPFGYNAVSVPWLANENVQVLADGGEDPFSLVPATGNVSLAANHNAIQIGLACPSTLTTMDVDGGATTGTAQGKIKRPSSVVVRVKNTFGAMIQVQGSGTPVALTQNRSTTPMGSPQPLFTGDVDRIGINSDPIPNCKLSITQPGPYQTEILGIFPVIRVEEPSP